MTLLLPSTTSDRVANHSWVGAATEATVNVEILKRLDWVIDRDEYIQVVAMNNGSGSATEPLLGSSFNAIAVGLSNGNSTHGSYPLATTPTTPYASDSRTRPDLVAPADYTSSATPIVASAAALLVEVGHKNPALSTDPLVQSTTNRNGDPIYNAERSEVVKAALMAGASRTSPNLTNNITPQGYVVDTDNGLNSSYGAGQLNIYNSYHIIAAGEQNSLQDAPGTYGNIGSTGFDYDPYFGGLRAAATGPPHIILNPWLTERSPPPWSGTWTLPITLTLPPSITWGCTFMTSRPTNWWVVPPALRTTPKTCGSP